MKNFILFITVFLFVSVQAQKPELVVQSGHNGIVGKIAFTKDGKFLASGSADGTVKFWDLSSNKEVRTFQTLVAVEDLAFSADGKILYVASADRSVIGFELIDGQKTTVFEKQNVSEFSSTKSALNSAKAIVARIVEDDSIRVSSIDERKELYKFLMPSEEGELDFGTGFFQLVFSEKGNILIGSTLDKIALINSADGKPIKIVKASNPNCLAASEDEKMFAVCERAESEKSFVTIRSAQTGAVLKKIDIQFGGAVALAFSPDGKSLRGIVKVENKEQALDFFKIYNWNALNGKEIGQAEFEKDSSSFWEFRNLKFSPDGKILALGAGDVSEGSVYVRDAESGKDIVRLKKNSFNIHRVRFLKNNLLAGGWRILDLKNGKQTADGVLDENALSSDGKKELKFNTVSGSFEIFETGSKKGLTKLNFKPLRATKNSVIFSPDDKYALSFCHQGYALNANDKVRLFDAATGELIFTFPDNSKLAGFSPNSKLLAYAAPIDEKKGQFAVKIWDVERKTQLQQIAVNALVSGFSEYFQNYDLYPVRVLSFNPDNSLLAVGGQNIIGTKNSGFLDLYEIGSGKLKRQIGDQGRLESIKFNFDGTILAAASAEKVLLFSTQNEKEKIVLSGHDSAVYALDFHENGKILASGGLDGQVIFWDYKTGNIISRLILTGETDFVLVSADNFYLASRKGAAAAVAFRQSARAFPFEQFDIRFNRPDLALASLGFASAETLELYAKAYQKRLRQNNLSESDLQGDLRLPEISLETASIPAVTREKTLRFKVIAADQSASLARLNVYVNDVSIYGAKGYSLSAAKSKNLNKDVALELTEGSNRVQVSVFNEKGAESIRQTFNIKYEGVSPKPELYLVAVGVSNYKDAEFNLKYPAIDVANITKLFETRTAEKEQAYVISPNPQDKTGLIEQPKSFYRLHKFELTNENATLEKIGGVRDFLKNAKPEDEVVIFISGHGLLDGEKNYYFATYDVDFRNPKERGLSFEKLEDLIDETAARRKILLIDTCHAGEVDKPELENLKMSAQIPGGVIKGIDLAARSGVFRLDGKSSQNIDEIAGELFADLRLGNGTVVVAASGGLEYAFESAKWSGGVFTYSVRLALEEMKADADRNGRISIAELRDFVGKKVSELTEGRQKPNFRRESIESDFRVY